MNSKATKIKDEYDKAIKQTMEIFDAEDGIAKADEYPYCWYW